VDELLLHSIVRDEIQDSGNANLQRMCWEIHIFHRVQINLNAIYCQYKTSCSFHLIHLGAKLRSKIHNVGQHSTLLFTDLIKNKWIHYFPIYFY